jgi:lysyl-tRNA synthetase class 2
MPPVAGIGIGIDRLVMIMADCTSISDINLFPATEMFNS